MDARRDRALRDDDRHLTLASVNDFSFFNDPADTAQFIAKAFLERDYDSIKARQAAPQPEDVVMSDADQKGAVEVQPPPAEQPVPIAEPTKVEPKAEEGVVAEVPQATEVVPESQPGGDAPVKKEKDSGNEAPADQGFPGANEGINFDSVLHGEGANSFDLNLDFGNDDMGDQAFLSGTFANTTETSADKPATSAAEDSTNAPAGGGAFDLELQNTGMESNPFPDQGTGDDIMGPGESSFDDLFMETENLGEDGTGDLNQLEGDSLMNLNELDDNWFN